MPKGVKKRGSKFRQNLINRTKYSKEKLKRKKQSKSSETAVKEAWDVKKTVEENLAAMGVASDPNAVVPIRQGRRQIIDAVPLEDDVVMEKTLDTKAEAKRYKKRMNPKAAEVVGALQQKAQEESDKIKEEKATVRRHHLPDRDIELVIYFLEKYDDDYQAMARDTRNLFQHTPKQIKKLVNIFKESPMFRAVNT